MIVPDGLVNIGVGPEAETGVGWASVKDQGASSGARRFLRERISPGYRSGTED